MQKIIDIYKSRAGEPMYSFEFFPPKDEAGEESLRAALQSLAQMKPDFASVTYGAGGSAQGRTSRWVTDIQREHAITGMAHFTCIGSSRAAVVNVLEDFKSNNIQNIMALRGDLPRDNPDYRPPVDGFRFANELIEFIHSEYPGFCIGAACYPEIHQEAPDAATDIENLKRKVDAGVDFLVTQLFFDNDRFLRFRDLCERQGIRVPIIPGIMPITAWSQIDRFTKMAACNIPQELQAALSVVQNEPQELRATSLAYSIRQCRDLLREGVPGLHFYTLNKSPVTIQILTTLQEGAL
ncbi:MAG: methylenetetrahydrofolate reductase [NAD(P)H] [Leptospiraceae bacterium]|nr:methylenetetrahydrofolate reductase [NAD(P)H] [Leptospiraceae bacterium]